MTWLYLPPVCLPSAPDTAASSSAWPWRASTVLCLSATWKGKPRQWGFWLKLWRREAWLRRLSGATCGPSTLARGAAAWISSLPGTHASRNHLPGCGVDLPITDGSGPTSPASSRSADPRSCSVKMSQGTLPGLSAPSSPTLPASGSMRSGVVRARKRLGRPIGVTGFSGQLPTPTASDHAGSGSAGYSTASGRHAGTTLWDAVVRGYRTLPTPTADGGRGYNRTPGSSNRRPGLGAMARDGLLPTPTASACDRNGQHRGHNAQGGPQLGEAVGAGHGRRLNPRFLEWMMGLPPGWLQLKS